MIRSTRFRQNRKGKKKEKLLLYTICLSTVSFHLLLSSKIEPIHFQSISLMSAFLHSPVSQNIGKLLFLLGRSRKDRRGCLTRRVLFPEREFWGVYGLLLIVWKGSRKSRFWRLTSLLALVSSFIILMCVILNFYRLLPTDSLVFAFFAVQDFPSPTSL